MTTMKQRNSSNVLLSKFFKVYLSGESGDDLELPVSFNSLLPKSLPRSVTVRSIYGKTWKMALRKCCGGEERYALVDGWKRIVMDEDLNSGDLLAFEFDGSQSFNFCIYECLTMCKRLRRSSVQTNEIKTESDGEEESTASDDVIVLDDDFDDDDDDDDDDEDDDDDNDDDYYCADDDNADDSTAKIVDDDDDDKAIDVVDTETGDNDYDDDDRKYLDDPENPSFKITVNPKKKSQLQIPAHIVKDYGLNFPENITVVDPLVKKFGTLVKKIKIQNNGSVFVKAFGSVIRRNKVKTSDKLIFELKKTGSNLVHTIKVYIING